MTEELSKSQKMIEFLYSIGLPPMRILRGLIALLVIGAIIGAIYFLNFDSFGTSKRDDENSKTEEVEDSRPTYEFELTLDQQIDELSFFDPTRGGYVVVYGELQKQNETIAELRKRSDISREQTKKLDGLQLRNLQNLALRTIQAGVNADIELKTFRDFAGKLASGTDESDQDLARYALTRTAVTVFAFSPTESNANFAIDAINQNQSAFVNNKSRAQILNSMLFRCKQQNPSNSFVDTCSVEIGKIFDTSTDAEVQLLGKQVGERSLFAQLDLATLEKRIRYQDKNALMDLDKALRVLEAHPEVDLVRWKIVMRSYEASLSVGRIENFATGREIFGDLINKLPNSDQRKSELLELMERQKIRAEQLGKKIDIAGATLNEKTIKPTSSDYSVLFMLDRSQRSIAIMQELGGFQTNGGTAFRPIVAFKDEFTEADADKVSQIPSWIFVADEETAKKYLASFPVDFYPYVLLIDQKGIVVAGNLSLVQVANRIAALERERKATGESAVD